MSFRTMSSKARRTPSVQQKPSKFSKEVQNLDKVSKRERERYEAADFAEDDADEDEEEEDAESLESESEGMDDSEDSEEGDDDEGENSDAQRDAQLKRIMKDLAQVPLGELADIQRKIGIKAFKSATARARAEQSDDEEEAEEKPTSSTQRSKVREKGEDRTRKIVPKREGKNRPVEMTAKRPVGRYRQVVEIPATKRRDPRFDPMSGHFNADAFSKKYAFLDEYRKSEMAELKKSIAKEKDPETKERLKMTLTRMQSQEKSKQLAESKQAIKREARKKEAELVKMGKNPYFLKRSEQKKLQHIAQFQALSKSKNGEKALETFMEKKRKRNATKERKHLPEMMKRRKADD